MLNPKFTKLLFGALFALPANTYAIMQVGNTHLVKQRTVCQVKTDIYNNVPVKYLILRYTNGNEIVFPLADNPIMELNDEELEMESSKEKISVELKSLNKFYFLEKMPSTGIRQHSKETTSQESFSISNGHILLRNFSKGTIVRIYTLGGLPVKETRIPNSGETDIDMTVYPKAVYILSLPSGKLKFINK